MPSLRPIFGSQPSALMREISRSLRGTPSGFDGSQSDTTLEADRLTHQLRELGDRHVLPGPDVDRCFLAVELHQQQHGCSKIVDVQEFAAWLAGAPYDNLRAPACWAS